MSTDGPAIYCGTIVRGDARDVLHATADGIYAIPEARTTVERWRQSGEAALVSTDEQLVAVLLRVTSPVALGILDGWRHVLRLREAQRELVLGPGEWTAVELTGDPS